MTMTRKDYNAIAEALRSVHTEPWTDGETVWVSCIEKVADALHASSGLDTNGNRRFDRDRFLAAASR
jgi:hypothetical protein